MQVKIYTLSNTNCKYNILNNKQNATTQFSNNNTELSNIYYTPINFKGKNDNYLTEQLMSLEGVHCPVCGTVMPNEENLQSIMEDFKSVKSANDFVEFLSRHEENIQPKFRSILDYSKRVANDNPDMSCESLMKILSSGSMKKFAAATKTTLYDVNNFIETNKDNLSDNDILLMYQYNDEVNKLLENRSLSYKKYKQIAEETIKKLETDKKWEIYDKVKNKVRDASIYRYIFISTKSCENSGTPTCESIVKNLFDMSSASITRVSDTIDNVDVEYNKVLECKHCKDSKLKLPYLLWTKVDGVNENFNKYIDDIGNAVLEDKLYKNTSYPLKVNALVKNLGKVDRSKNDNPILSKVKNKEFIEGLNEVKFEVLEFSNVPCACCGNMTITHNEKKVIENEIKNAKNLKELSDISHKYYKLIRQNYRPVINKFQRIVSERPKISDEDMLKCLKSYCNEEINNTLKRSVERFSDPDVLIKYNSRSRECLKEYVNKTKENFLDLNKKKTFPYSEYYDMLVNTIGKMDDYSRDKILYGMKMSVKRKFFPQVILYSDRSSAKDYDSYLKYVISTIITKAVATKDHLQASHLGGSDNKENLVVMCKDCNNEKGTDDFKYFVKHHGQFKHNFVRYLAEVKKLVQTGQLEGYDTYIHDIIQHINDDLMDGVVLFNENMI